MKTSLHRASLLLLGLVSSAARAHAHPGHDGHDLTWDARHLANHPLATLGCAAILGGGLFLAIRAFRSPRETQTARVSSHR